MNTVTTRIETYRISGRIGQRSRAESKFRKHAKRLAQEGWTPVSTEWVQEKPGCLTLWMFSPGGKLSVTYTRQAPDESISRS